MSAGVLFKAMAGLAPRPFEQYLESCLIQNYFRRPADAMQVYADFTEAIADVYGKPRFFELVV